MSGVVATIYARRALDDEMLESIDGTVAEFSAALRRTRKGRTWDCTIGDRLVHVRIEEIEKVLQDCEEELLKLGLVPEDAPFRVTLTSPCSTHEDKEIVGKLAIQISRVVNGIVVGPA